MNEFLYIQYIIHMKSFIIILLVTFIFTFSKNEVDFVTQEAEMYNVYEYSMVLEEGQISSVYTDNYRCYSTKVEFYHNKEYYYLKSDSFNIKFYIANRTESKSNQSNVIHYLVAKVGNPHPFSLNEIRNDNRFYIVITPIRFNHMSAINESGMVISTETVCRSGIQLVSN